MSRFTQRNSVEATFHRVVDEETTKSTIKRENQSLQLSLLKISSAPLSETIEITLDIRGNGIIIRQTDAEK